MYYCTSVNLYISKLKLTENYFKNSVSFGTKKHLKIMDIVTEIQIYITAHLIFY